MVFPRQLRAALVALLATRTNAFVVEHIAAAHRATRRIAAPHCRFMVAINGDTQEDDNNDNEIDPSSSLSRRRIVLRIAPAALLLASVSSLQPASADVSDGNALPQGAQQFANVVKLKTNLKVRQIK